MKIYDISQEIFNCQVYPGDPIPEKKTLCSMENGDVYNLSAFSMCAHNGTHIDAPFHFINGGKTVDSISLDAFIGMAFVVEHHGIVSGGDAVEIFEKVYVLISPLDSSFALLATLDSESASLESVKLVSNFPITP